MSALLKPPIHRQIRNELYQHYDDSIARGTYIPLTSASFSWGLLALFLFFQVPPTSRLHNRFTRYTVFAIVLAWHTYLVACFQARSVAVVYGAGISSAWGTLWAATLLVFRDAKTEFRRLEQRKVKRGEVESANGNGSAVAATSSQHELRRKADESDLRRRAHIAQQEDENSPNDIKDNETNSSTDIEYIWQPYPSTSTFWHRLCWTTDLLTNFRGAGWNWRISGLPSLPLHVQASLARTSPSSTQDSQLKDQPISHIGINRYDTVPPLLKHNIVLLIRHYLTIDLLLTLMHHDSYFYTGLPSTPAPAYLTPFLPSPTGHPILSHIILKSTRLLLSMLTVSTCLKFACALGAPTFSYLLSSTTSPFPSAPWPFNHLPFLTSASPPWLYPDAFGPYTNVFTRGLTGWSGAWWHQLFRFAFQSAGEFAVDTLGVGRRSKWGRGLQVLVVFVVSGCVHASGSLMLSVRRAEARPVTGAGGFFVVQAVGVVLEMAAKELWGLLNGGEKQKGKQQKKEESAVQKWMYGAIRFIWVHVWFYFTASLLVDDFARSGVWTFEPIGVSLFRGLGLGVEGDGWWCWGGGKMAWWYDGGWGRWWNTGVAF